MIGSCGSADLSRHRQKFCALFVGPTRSSCVGLTPFKLQSCYSARPGASPEVLRRDLCGDARRGEPDPCLTRISQWPPASRPGLQIARHCGLKIPIVAPSRRLAPCNRCHRIVPIDGTAIRRTWESPQQFTRADQKPTTTGETLELRSADESCPSCGADLVISEIRLTAEFRRQGSPKDSSTSLRTPTLPAAPSAADFSKSP